MYWICYTAGGKQRHESSSATPPRTVSIIFPVGVDVSIASLNETKPIPNEENVSSARSK
jgi:hypothetical protein